MTIHTTYYPIIALSGKAGSGKNQAADYVADSLALTGIEVHAIGFADALKARATALGWDGTKDVNGRTLLQYLGARERQDNENYWVDQLFERIERDDLSVIVWVITDCRYRNEADAVRNTPGGEVWRIVRMVEGQPYDNGLNEEQKVHPSETALDDYPFFDETIVADSLETLREKVYEATSFRWGKR